MDYGRIMLTMNKFYKKASPETMKKNRDTAQQEFLNEIKWLKENLGKLNTYKHKFLIDMYSYLITGSRRITPKMGDAIRTSIEKCKNSPRYNPEMADKADEKLKPIIEKIAMVEKLAEQKGDKALPFVRNVKEFALQNHMITTKQMTALNKVYKRVSEDLFE